MSDRFKIRVWDNLINEYRKEGTIQLSGNGQPFIIDGDMQPEDIDDVIIEQCTGLTDKNGKLVYEGDVLQAPGQTIAYKVQWVHHSFVMKTGFSSAKSYPLGNCEMFEIIGNVHEVESKNE